MKQCSQEKESWLTALLEWAMCELAVAVAAFSIYKKGVRALPAEGTAPRVGAGDFGGGE